MTKRVLLVAVALILAAATIANANVTLSSLFGNNMVLQRDKAIPVYGTELPGQSVSVTFNGQTRSATADALGNWQVTLPAMAAKATGGNLVATGKNTVTITNVVIGDVWVCSGQSNMDFTLSQTGQTTDVSTANFPGIRYFGVTVVQSAEPTRSFTGSWSVCSSSTAGGYSGVAFYFARKIYQDQSANIPIGIVKSAQGGTTIDVWLSPEGTSDIPTLQPLYSMPIVQWGPFCLFNGMIYPLSPYAIKGFLWYQGEYGESTNQSPDSYYLKEKALIRGWRSLWGGEDLPFYLVLIANLDAAPTTATPESGGWPLIRDFQRDALAIPHTGMASALDVGDANDIHPADKYDVGERLALWALKNEYGHSSIVPSGPILRDVTVSGSNLTCTFDYVGSGLMVGSKTLYQPTQEVVGGTLQRFSIAASNGVWYAANAVINTDNTITVSSPSVSAPRKVAYAYWKNPAGANLYNRDGLPATPFYVDDVTVKYTITASAGAGGSISPDGATTYLKRTTAGYTITPDAGSYIQDVKVDGVSVGSVRSYTFDPLYANHTIAATFATTAPSYTINASSGAGGSISPTGAVTTAQGGAQTFSVLANSSSHISQVTVDGAPVGKRSTFTFSDVRSNHAISATFACTITASASYGGTISPSGATQVGYGTNQTYAITPIPGYSISDVKVDGASVGAVPSYTFSSVSADHTIYASFSGGGSGSIPQTSQMILSCLASALPTSGSISSWSTNYPSGQSLATIGSPTVETINGRKWERNIYADGDGFRFGSSYSSPIACTGASIVVAAKPIRSGDMGNWRSIVDVFYDRLVFGLTNDAGQVCVRRNGSVDFSSATIPDGQITVLSLVVQSNGTYKVWANGSLIYTNTNTSDMTSLVPGVAGGAGGFGSYINVGRNNPDGWTTFSGNIGDVFLYKTALSDADRQALETYIANKLTDYTITASAGAGGTISPLGATTVVGGSSKSYTIAPAVGYVISSVTVDGVSQGAIASYTFNNIGASHTISAAFTPITYTITASAGSNGSISPSGNVSVNYGASQAFAITPSAGYGIASLKTDGASIRPSVGYAFSNVTANHTIAATFGRPVGMNNRTALTDGKVLGRVVKLWGTVKSVSGTSSFVMSGYTYKDKVTKAAVTVDVNVAINGATLPTGFAVDKLVTVIGVISADKTLQSQVISVVS